MNTKWFREQLQRIELSQRGLAKLLGIDAAAVSYMLRGKRKMTLQEANRVGLGFVLTMFLHHRWCEFLNVAIHSGCRLLMADDQPDKAQP